MGTIKKNSKEKTFREAIDNFLKKPIPYIFKFIYKAALVISAPLAVVICSRQETPIIVAVFIIIVLILLLAILWGTYRNELELKSIKQSQFEPTIEIVNRHELDSSIGYSNILKYFTESEKETYIISSPKKTFDSSRWQYIYEIEKELERKLKYNGSYTYQRLIPVSKVQELLDDKFLTNHYDNVNKLGKVHSNVECTLINELESTYHFAIIDSKILILFFPKYVPTSGKPSDDCSFHLILKYREESTFLRYLRQQHSLLGKKERIKTSISEQKLKEEINKVKEFIKKNYTEKSNLKSKKTTNKDELENIDKIFDSQENQV